MVIKKSYSLETFDQQTMPYNLYPNRTTLILRRWSSSFFDTACAGEMLLEFKRTNTNVYVSSFTGCLFFEDLIVLNPFGNVTINERFAEPELNLRSKYFE
jgi:hypothetical protein